MMAAVYGYPKGGSKLPGLVQIHGGGQHASHMAVLTNAKRGYATISIAWAGRLFAPDYKVNHAEVELFWVGKPDDPNHLVATDWGALDAYHDPSRHKGTNFGGYKPTEWTLDAVESPRNSAWFPCAFAARWALTFLEQQPEVDANRFGVYGHSMGGKLSVLADGSDGRVKAVAPSCGGISHREIKSPLDATLNDNNYLENIACPIIFLSPSNDFHGRINDLPAAVEEIKTPEWRLVISPHHNHQDTPEYEVATQVWMDHFLKGEGTIPKTPKTTLALQADGGVPVLIVEPNTSKPVLGVEVYYTCEGQMDGKPVDVRVLAEFQNDRFLAAFDPNIDLRIEVEVACGFLREVVDALIGNARVLALLAGHALLVHEEEAVIRENDQVAKELVGVLD
jgi:dienelactone hydrolase